MHKNSSSIIIKLSKAATTSNVIVKYSRPDISYMLCSLITYVVFASIVFLSAKFRGNSASSVSTVQKTKSKPIKYFTN